MRSQAAGLWYGAHFLFALWESPKWNISPLWHYHVHKEATGNSGGESYVVSVIKYSITQTSPRRESGNWNAVMNYSCFPIR